MSFFFGSLSLCKSVYLCVLYVCVLTDASASLSLCPHTTIYISLAFMPHTSIRVLILLYTCPPTAVYVSSYYHMCVLTLLDTQRAIFELNKSGRYYDYKERLKKSTIAVVRESFFKEV